MASHSGTSRSLLRLNARTHQRIDLPRDRLPSFVRASLSDRDRDILLCACRKLDGSAADFAEAVRALQEAVEERIPAGRVYCLSSDIGGPAIGSIISGVGIAADAEGVLVVRIAPGGSRTILGKLAL